MSVVAVYEKNGGGGGSGGVGYDGHAHVVRDEASCIVQQNSGESGSTLKAHDYIGLSEVTSTPHKMENAESKTIPDLNLGETELRLGPPKTFKSSVQGVDNSAADASQQMWPKVNGASSNEGFQMKMRESHDTKVVDVNESKDAEARESAADAHKFWQAHIARNMEQVRSMMSNQSQQEIQEMGTYNNAALNASNLKAVSGAKRGFSEALGNGSFEGRSVMPTIAPVVSGNASQNGKSPMIPAMYPWSLSKQLPAAWKMGLEQSKGSFGPFPSSRQQQQQQHQQQQQQKNMGDANESNNAWDSSSTSKTSGKGNGGQKQQNKEHDNNEDVAPASSPPVVGWPPVQSFRKNTLASHPPKPSSTPDSTKAAAAPSATAAAPSAIPAASNSTPALPPTANSSVTPLLVKVYMDGVPIGRKVDLKSHNSYEKLSSVLEEMFHRFIINQNGTEAASTKDSSLTQESKKLNFLHGSEFVLTYEDKDGDLMLVGDVPWGMFTGTVRRLRIMKGSEAIGLAAPRAAEKVTMSS